MRIAKCLALLLVCASCTQQPEEALLAARVVVAVGQQHVVAGIGQGGLHQPGDPQDPNALRTDVGRLYNRALEKELDGRSDIYAVGCEQE